MASLFQEFFPDCCGLYLWVLPFIWALDPCAVQILRSHQASRSPGPAFTLVALMRLYVPTSWGLFMNSRDCPG